MSISVSLHQIYRYSIRFLIDFIAIQTSDNPALWTQCPCRWNRAYVIISYWELPPQSVFNCHLGSRWINALHTQSLLIRGVPFAFEIKHYAMLGSVQVFSVSVSTNQTAFVLRNETDEVDENLASFSVPRNVFLRAWRSLIIFKGRLIN